MKIQMRYAWMSLALFFVPFLPAKDFALIVGVNEYFNFNGAHDLNGPGNDSLLFQTLLLQLGVEEENIRLMNNKQDDFLLSPYKWNILKGFDWLVEQSETYGEDANIIIFLSGHGTRVPSKEDVEEFEPDGMDEAFLPSDLGEWDPLSKSMPNAILDDDINRYVEKILATGAFVWFVADSCHSGTLLRGAPADEKVKGIDESLLIPEEFLQTARTRSAASAEESSILNVTANKGKFVAMYAARPSEQTPEVRVEGEAIGLFNYNLCKVALNSSRDLTYRQLFDRVINRYHADNRWYPKPLLEGDGVDRRILSSEEVESDRTFAVTKIADTGEMEINAGQLLGIYPGSLLAVYEPEDTHYQTPKAMIEVMESELLTSKVKDTGEDFEGEAIEVGDICVVDQLVLSSRKLKVSLVTDSSSSGGSQAETQSAIDAPYGSFIEWIKDAEDSDYTVELSQDRAAIYKTHALLPNGTWAKQLIASFNNLSTSDDRVDALSEALLKIYKAYHLLNMSSEIGADGSFDEVSRLSVKLMRKNENGEFENLTPDGSSSEIPSLSAGDVVYFEVENESIFDLDFSLLHIDPQYGISCLTDAKDGRLVAFESYRTPGTFTVTDDTLGVEQLLVVAVRSNARVSTNFCNLSQESIRVEDQRGAGGGGVSEFDNMVDLLFSTSSKSRNNGDQTVVTKAIAWETVR